MKSKYAIQHSLIYRFRYHIVGLLLVLMAALMAIYNFWSLPSGLTQAELTSASISGSVSSPLQLFKSSPNGSSIVNLPWLLLQSLSVRLLGLTPLGIRLPAAILGLLFASLTILLLRRLTKPNLAMMGGLLLVSSSFAIGLSRAGVAAIMTLVLLNCVMLSSFRLVSGRGKQLVSLFCLAVSTGLLCYMVGGIYLVMALLLVAILHPQARLALCSNKKPLLLAALLWLLIILPLLINVFLGLANGQHSTINQLILLGRPTIANLQSLGLSLVGPKAHVVGGLVTPMISAAGAVMAVVGLVTAARDRASSIRFYAVIGLIVVCLVLGACQPELFYLLATPAIILETFCLSFIVNRWYSLFPTNPYARAFAILPLAVLIGSLCSVNIGRYFNSINYNRDVVYNFDQTLATLNKLLAQNKQTTLIITPTDQYALYRSLSRDNIEVRPADNQKNDLADQWLAEHGDGRLIVLSGSASFSLPDDLKLDKVYCSWHSQGNLLLSVYTNN